MPANRMNHDEFYAAMASHEDARLRTLAGDAGVQAHVGALEALRCRLD